jgi:CRISPR system Cascade subunit CasE
MTGTALYMLHLPVDTRRLLAFAGARHADTGYRLHALFAALFGPAAPKPFAISGTAGTGGNGDPACLPVLAYSSQPLGALQSVAQGTAVPSAYGAVRWEEAADKPMPIRFPTGLVLGFTVRACPVVRLARGAAGRPDGHGKRPGAEVDAFIAALDRAESGGVVDREEIYRRWLEEQLGRDGGAEIRSLRIEALRRSPVFRQGSVPDRARADKRSGRSFDRPDVSFSGLIAITAPDAFAARLARGIGRHRAFGFGMLLLRPA